MLRVIEWYWFYLIEWFWIRFWTSSTVTTCSLTKFSSYLWFIKINYLSIAMLGYSFWVCWLSTCTYRLHLSVTMIRVCAPSIMFSTSSISPIVTVPWLYTVRVSAPRHAPNVTSITVEDRTISIVWLSASLRSHPVAIYKCVRCWLFPSLVKVTFSSFMLNPTIVRTLITFWFCSVTKTSSFIN